MSDATPKQSSAGAKEQRTNPNAKPIRFRAVSNAWVVHLTGASYRGATFDGTFEVSKQQMSEMPDARNRILCKVQWFGWTAREGLAIEVRKGGWRFEMGYTGPVVVEIGI